MITIEEYLEGRDLAYPPTDEMMQSLEDLLEKISMLELELNLSFEMTGGYRPEIMIENHALPGCPHDAHSDCTGIDLHDPNLDISKRLLEDPAILEEVGLYMESPVSSKNHLHLQSRAPKSGNRIFIA